MTLLEKQIRPRAIVTRKALENAAMVVAATGGSTNAALHLPAMANEAGITFDLFDVEEIFRRTPYLASLKPGGEFVAKDMWEAGGVPMLMRTLLVIHLSWIDRLVGSAVGATIMAIVTGIIVMLMAVVLPADAAIIRDSSLAPRLLLYNQELVRYIPEDVKQAYENKRAEIIRSWIEKETRLTESPVASPQASPSN